MIRKRKERNMKAEATSLDELKELGFTEVLEKKHKGTPSVSISARGAYFNGATVCEVNSEYALMLFNSETQKLLLIPAKKTDPYSMALGAHLRAREGGTVTSARKLLATLKRNSEWDFDKHRYAALGEYVESLGGVLFDLGAATPEKKRTRRMKK